MIFNENQRSIVEQLKYLIENRERPEQKFVMNLCEAFGGHILTSFIGMGGTRIVITHPFKDGVLKIAFNEDGIKGNEDEFKTFQEASTELKSMLGKTGDMFEGGIFLEMDYYEPIPEEDFDNYAEALAELLKKVEFIFYQDPPYFHSFGTENGKLILIDYGETEQIKIL